VPLVTLQLKRPERQRMELRWRQTSSSRLRNRFAEAFPDFGRLA